MSALPRPDLPPGSHHDLVAELHDLHHRAGWPSLRALARETGVSHTTVSKAFSAPALPTWGTLELLVEALGGSTAEFHALWLAASDRDHATPTPNIAGRASELAVVRRHLASGYGLLLVTGEAGIGKTTLIEAAVAPVDAFVAFVRCWPMSREMPLMPVVDALRLIHEVDAGRWVEEALSQCPAYVRRSLARLLPELDPDADAAPPDDPWGLERLFASITSTLRALAAARPLVLCVEDCHWADRSTLDLLAHLASVPSQPPVVVSWRTGDPDVSGGHSEWVSRIRWASGTTAVDLLPLTLPETAEQLRLLRGSGTDDEVARRIQARTRGVPLYTAQLAPNPDEKGLPRLLADLLDRRIGDLDDEAWRVARALGLAQRRVGPGMLRAATDLTADAVDNALRVLAGRRLLRPGSGDDAELAHPLLVEAIERRLVPGEAAEMHARLAEALASASGIQPGEVADHWRAAGRPDREVFHRAAAARRASEHFAYQEALASWLRVLELWDAGHPDSGLDLWDILVQALDAAIEVGDLDAGGALASRAESLDLPAPRRAQVLRRVGSVMYDEGEVARAEELLDESLLLLEQVPDSRDLLCVLEERFWMFLQSGRYAEAEAALTRSLDLLDAHDDPGLRRRTLAGVMWLTMSTTGDVEASLAIAQRASEAQLHEPDPIADLMIAASATDILLGVPSSAARAEEFARGALREAEAWGLELTYPAVLVRGNICWAHLCNGDTSAAHEWIRPITHSNPVPNTVFAHVMLAAVELREGDVATALERCRSADEQVHNRNDNWAEGVPWIAEVELWGARPDRAADLLRRAIDSRLTCEAAAQTAPLLVCLARACADVLDGAGASTARRHTVGRELRDLVPGAGADPFAPDTFGAAASARSATWLAELSRLEGNATVEVWSHAASAWDQVHRPHDAAYCRWRAAQVAVRQGHGTLAARLLRRAATDAREHVPLLEAIAATRAST